MSTGELFSTEEMRAFTKDSEVRERRRAKKLAAIAVPKPPIRGKRRLPGIGASPEAKPQPVGEEAIVRLGKVLKHEEPLVDEITKYGRPDPDPDIISRYVRGGNRRWLEAPKTVEERQAAFRQTMHIEDTFQRNTRAKGSTARINRAALSSVQASVREGIPFNAEAARYAAAAIEDFGICLREYPDVVARVGSGDELPATIEHVGVYASEHPEIFYEEPMLLRLVQIEQAKREEGWEAILDTTLRMQGYGDRSTQADREAEANVQELIASFGVHAEPTA